MKIILPDGRILAYAEYGDPHGLPLFFFHGVPGSRLFRPPDEITQRMGVRLICTDRPGYGLSSFQPGRRILDWPDDVAHLADYLGLETFFVAGHSGGAPYATACAWKLPQRVRAALIFSGMGPVDAPGALEGMWARNRLGFRVGRFAPWPLWRALIWLFFHKSPDEPKRASKRGQSQRPRADARLWEDPTIRRICYQSEAEAFRCGTRGHAWETRLIARPWGFRLEDILPPVYLWHGTEDNLTPIAMAHYLTEAIPNCQAVFFEGEAHLLLFPHWEEILTSLRNI